MREKGALRSNARAPFKAERVLKMVRPHAPVKTNAAQSPGEEYPALPGCDGVLSVVYPNEVAVLASTAQPVGLRLRAPHIPPLPCSVVRVGRHVFPASGSE